MSHFRGASSRWNSQMSTKPTARGQETKLGVETMQEVESNDAGSARVCQDFAPIGVEVMCGEAWWPLPGHRRSGLKALTTTCSPRPGPAKGATAIGKRNVRGRANDHNDTRAVNHGQRTDERRMPNAELPLEDPRPADPHRPRYGHSMPKLSKILPWDDQLMPRCKCGAWVSSDFVQVCLLDDVEAIEACIECANREGFAGGIRQ